MDRQLPLTAAQEGVWIGQQLDPENPLYNAAEYLEIDGSIDTARFERALRQAVAETDALHVRFVDGPDGIVQRLAPARDWELPVFAVGTRADALAWMRDDLRQLVDLERGPLFAHALLELGCGRVLWYHRAHHIALDGYGFSLVAARVAALYNDQATPALGSLRGVVEDDLAYQRSRRREEDREFWHRRFADRPAVVSLSERAAPPCGRVVRGSVELPLDAMAGWRSLADEASSSWVHVVLALVACHLRRETGASEVILGVPVMGRLGSRTARAPAMIVNVVALRVRMADGARPHEVVRTVARELERVRPHQRYRAEHLRRELDLVGGERRLYGPMVNILPFDYGLRFGPRRATARNLSAGAQFVEDLAIHIHARLDGEPLIVDVDANAASYSPSDLATRLEPLTDALTADAIPA